MQRNIEKYTLDYASGERRFEAIQVKYRRKKVLEILNDYKPQNILEIGCGRNSISNYYTKFNTFTIVEPSKQFAQVCLKEKNDNITIINDFFENTVSHLKQQSFDFIICSSVLHEVVSPNEILSNIKNICTKETILHINVPNAMSFHLVWAYESGLISNLGNLTPTAKTLQQHNTFTLESLKHQVENIGFKVKDSGSYFIKPFNHDKMAVLLENEQLNDKLLDGLYNMTKYMPEFGSEIYVNCKLQ